MIAMWLLPVVSLVAGLVVGSFLNVVIYRVPRHLSVVRPGSFCPDCRTPIAPRDNIPVLGWLLLRGRCRACGARISPRYPLVEAGTGVAFAATAWITERYVTSGALAWTVFACVVVSFAIALSAIDIDLHRLPNTLTIPLLVVVVLGLPLAATAAGLPAASWPLGRALASGAAWTAVYVLLWAGAPLIFGKAGMGFGDVKLAPSLGLLTGWVGWPASVIGFFAAFVAGLLIAIPVLLLRRDAADRKLAHGPNMFIGAAAGILFGAAVTRAYFSLIGL